MQSLHDVRRATRAQVHDESRAGGFQSGEGQLVSNIVDVDSLFDKQGVSQPTAHRRPPYPGFGDSPIVGWLSTAPDGPQDEGHGRPESINHRHADFQYDGDREEVFAEHKPACHETST
jgi:hypothetical protein